MQQSVFAVVYNDAECSVDCGADTNLQLRRRSWAVV